MKALIALCVGHSRKIGIRTEGGAISCAGVSEHAYNTVLAEMIASELRNAGARVMILTEYKGTGYTTAQKWVASQLKEAGTSLCVELHFNSADSPAASGHEWLYWVHSANGKRLAASLHNEMLASFPELKARGIKPLAPGDRGTEFVKLTPCPAVICEPFFGSSPHDWDIAVAHKSELAQAIARGIIHYLS